MAYCEESAKAVKNLQKHGSLRFFAGSALQGTVDSPS
jgi:hypothetical protein